MVQIAECIGGEPRVPKQICHRGYLAAGGDRRVDARDGGPKCSLRGLANAGDELGDCYADVGADYHRAQAQSGRLWRKGHVHEAGTGRGYDVEAAVVAAGGQLEVGVDAELAVGEHLDFEGLDVEVAIVGEIDRHHHGDAAWCVSDSSGAKIGGAEIRLGSETRAHILRLAHGHVAVRIRSLAGARTAPTHECRAATRIRRKRDQCPVRIICRT